MEWYEKIQELMDEKEMIDDKVSELIKISNEKLKEMAELLEELAKELEDHFGYKFKVKVHIDPEDYSDYIMMHIYTKLNAKSFREKIMELKKIYSEVREYIESKYERLPYFGLLAEDIRC